ncbi:DNA annealing helicase and endonuclease ZRANB3 isoform X2 [Denticeps clupeoides]|uniref:DNA annealing helicase and endonuclease ZRANB3 isoform X2 n=1 Tax=Denticeps clupeoides TaxID=299321 RepID=UPI0010A2F2CF|nr:DNA annealing helicase and endonuclease ZRANB3 isoform X2 [Denticeps clupeoides]
MNEEMQVSRPAPDTAGEELLVLPEKLQKRLMPFQREGIEFALSQNGRCMIADEMGLGKTIQAISVAYIYRQEWPLLIVVPSSLKYPWIEELERWVPDLKPGDINLVENKSDTAGIASSKVTILGYGLLTTDARHLVDALTRQKFQVVVVDESHYLKTRNAARTKLLVPVIQSARRAILLTGTPALGRPEELFMQIDALYPRRFGSWSEYAKKYCNAHYRFFGNRRQWDCRGASHLDELHQRLSAIMIRRQKAQVLTQLPPKIRQRIPFDLPKDGAKQASGSFEEWEKLMRTLDSGVSVTDNPFVEVMGLITRMYQQTAVAKAGAVKDYIKMLLENEQLKFLVFAHHLVMLQACTEAVIEAKAGYIRIDGSVPSSERIQLVHKFQSDPETRVAILSIQAAGQGLTFTAATHVVFAELYWNPGHVKQAEDRAHRIGQTSSVHVHYLIAKGTFDTVMWGMLNRKETVTGSTLNGRKEYLKAEIGDKEKWDFLNFAKAWSPNEALLGREVEKDEDGVFFSHFEKDRQHDIRSFFSPHGGKEKKRKRTEDEVVSETSPFARSQEPLRENSEGPEEPTTSISQEKDYFAPQVKRLRKAGGKRMSWGGKTGSCPSIFTPRRLSEGSGNQRWSCCDCTYSNSALLPYCEMCEKPRPGHSSAALSRTAHPLQQAEPVDPPSNQSPCGRLSEGPHNQIPAAKTSQLEEEGEGCVPPELVGASPPGSREDGAGDSTFPLYESLRFCASPNTDRIFLYDKDGLPLSCNFVPLDIQLDNWEDLPAEFERRENRRLVQRFVQEWNSLTAMKQRLVRKSGRVFLSPILLLDELTSTQRRHSSTKRYLTKEDVAKASVTKAQKDGGTVRVVNKDCFFTKKTSSSSPLPISADSGTEASSIDKESRTVAVSEDGYVQALDSAGNPLCLSCQLPCHSSGTWDARFCGQRCQEEFQVRSNQGYMRARVLETEQGVCQMCGLNGHQLYQRVRDAPAAHRKPLLENTWLAQLPLKQLNEMIRNPVEGHFWQVDHIQPVYSGGGQCLLDNLQTLCTVCHRARTAQQAKERTLMKRGQAASKVATDITHFFQRK